MASEQSFGEFVWCRISFIFVITAFIALGFISFYLAETKHQKEAVEAELACIKVETEKRIDNLIEENNQLIYRLEQYENSEVLYGIQFIMSRNNKIDVKQARKIAESVVEHSAQFELDYKLVLAIIWQESRFNAEAKSNQQAHGLMQLIPDTQKALAKILKIETWDITDVNTNILFGTAYLARLKKIYNGDVKLMLAAYNGGPVCAKRYQRYINGEIPIDSLSTENVGYIRSITNLYGKM